jgi:hypothetical protein
MRKLRVHVFGQPEQHMPMDERLCEEPDGGEEVVYHVSIREVVTRGRVRYMCRDCGESTFDEVEAAC